jgi:two-component system, cell cycle response regulator DivK
MSKRVLYIEDNDQNMRLVRKILEHHGYEVVGANTGLLGVESALSGAIDLVLMDINLPDIDGKEATYRIKTANPAMPVIALTANAMYGDEERILAAGCDGYISKPISKSVLLEKLVSILGE